jgi:hypothetical protein
MYAVRSIRPHHYGLQASMIQRQKNIKHPYIYPITTYTPKKMSRRERTGYPTTGGAFNERSAYMGLLLDTVALGHVFSEYSAFSCQFSFHQDFYFLRYNVLYPVEN